ncbi:MAG: Crp/Fnr family transcriptional regulator, partial [Alphaproteobacteria bacterium]|nr:Crp/Fnr family transcriptional regulator [Alphaproteobacteria bacterium]
MPFRTYSEILNNIKLFEGVAAEERDKLLSQGQIRHLQEGEVLFRCGDAIDHFYIVCAGAVRLMRETPDGKQVTTDIPITGKTIGKPDIFEAGHKNHRVTAIAIEPTIVLVFTTLWLLKIAQHPAFALNILSAISEYAHIVELEAEQRSTMNAA